MTSASEPRSYEETLARMLIIAQTQWGHWIRSYWFYEADRCPGCEGLLDTLRIKGREALSLNVFIYRRRGVLIGYCLCRRCAGAIFMAAHKRPGVQIGLHVRIEERLIEAYERHIAATIDA